MKWQDYDGDSIPKIESFRHSPHVDAYSANYRFNIIPRDGRDTDTIWYVLDDRKVIFMSPLNGYAGMLEARDYLQKFLSHARWND